jgi:hypothetical protein
VSVIGMVSSGISLVEPRRGWWRACRILPQVSHGLTRHRLARARWKTRFVGERCVRHLFPVVACYRTLHAAAGSTGAASRNRRRIHDEEEAIA